MTRATALGLLGLVAGCAVVSRAAPRPVPAGWSGVTSFLDSAIAAGAAPGAVLGVSLTGCHYFHGTGRLGREAPTRPDSATVYDLASLTKVVALTTIVMHGVEHGALALDTPISHYVPQFATPSADATGSGSPPSDAGTVPSGRSAVTLRHLLTHSSGLPAWRALYLETGDRAGAFALADTTPLSVTPGDSFVYSDLGAIVLTQAVERTLGARIDSLVDRLLARPLGLKETRYLPPPAWLGRIAPTEQDPWRGRMLRGEVHDENAARLDGVSGHAGLFGSARDLLRFGDWLLRGLQPGDSASAGCPGPAFPPPPGDVAAFVRRQDRPAGSSRALGWDTPSGASSGGTLIAPTSFGHTGFTGTSIWIDPTRRLVVVLLANRVHPTRDNPRFGAIRGPVADRVVRAFGLDSLSP